MINVIIIGSSLLGFDIVNFIENSSSRFDYVFSGYFDDNGPLQAYQEIKIPYLGTIKDLVVNSEDKYLIAVESVSLRIKLVEVISGAGGNFLTYIHPTAILGNFVTKGEGIFVGPYCVVADYCHLGSFSILKSKNLVRKHSSIGLFCLLGEYVVVGTGVTLADGNYLGIGSVIKSVHSNFHVEYSELHKKNPLDLKWNNIPWISLN